MIGSYYGKKKYYNTKNCKLLSIMFDNPSISYHLVIFFYFFFKFGVWYDVITEKQQQQQ